MRPVWLDRGEFRRTASNPETVYRDRSGRTIANDNEARWLTPAFTEMHRVLKDGTFCISFYGWNAAWPELDRVRCVGRAPAGSTVVTGAGYPIFLVVVVRCSFGS